MINRRKFISGTLAGAAAISASALAGNPTPAQVEGPFYPKRQRADSDADLTRVEGREGRAKGEVIQISGQVRDTEGAPIQGARVDVWQANSYGRYDHEDDSSEAPLDPDFQSWAVLTTDQEGRYSFTTIKPAAYAAMGDWVRPPHIHFKVAKRGFRELTTQMYFPDEPLNEKDALYLEAPAGQRKDLVARFVSGGEVPHGHFNIVIEEVVA